MTSTPTLRTAASLALLLALSPSPGEAAKKPLFDVRDPAGDDHGNGSLVYPLRSDFTRGDLDVVAFRAEAEKDGTTFEVEFARKVREPQRGAIDGLGTDLVDVARDGFYTFNVDLYVDRDRIPDSGGLAMLPGRLAEVDPRHAWDRAVVVTPRPAEVRSALRTLWVRSLKETLREQDDDGLDDAESAAVQSSVRASLADNVYFPNQIRVQGRKLRFFVPAEFLGGVASPTWSYVLVVTGADLISSFDLGARAGVGPSIADNLMAIPISPGTWQDRMGGGREAEPLQPPLVDVLTPQAGLQERLLSDFSSRLERPVKLPGVVPAEVR